MFDEVMEIITRIRSHSRALESDLERIFEGLTSLQPCISGPSTSLLLDLKRLISTQSILTAQKLKNDCFAFPTEKLMELEGLLPRLASALTRARADSSALAEHIHRQVASTFAFLERPDEPSSGFQLSVDLALLPLSAGDGPADFAHAVAQSLLKGELDSEAYKGALKIREFLKAGGRGVEGLRGWGVEGLKSFDGGEVGKSADSDTPRSEFSFQQAPKGHLPRTSEDTSGLTHAELQAILQIPSIPFSIQADEESDLDFR